MLRIARLGDNRMLISQNQGRKDMSIPRTPNLNIELPEHACLARNVGYAAAER